MRVATFYTTVSAAACSPARNLRVRYGFGTITVNTYPHGISPSDAWDMMGNIWEWNMDWGDEKKKLASSVAGFGTPAVGTPVVLTAATSIPMSGVTVSVFE